MLLNYYTLTKLEHELQALIGLEIGSVFTQEKNSLIIEFISDENYYLDFSADPKYSCCFVSNNFSRAGKNTLDLFDDLIGEIVQSINLLNFDRVFKIELINSYLYIILFGRGSSNVILTKKDNTIIDAFEEKSSLLNTHFQTRASDIVLDETQSVFDLLAKSPFIMGNKLAKEFLYLYNINPEDKISDLTFDLSQKVNEFLLKCKSSKTYIYKQNKINSLSPIELNHLRISPERVFDSTSTAIKWKKINDIESDKINEESKGISRLIENEISKTRARYNRAENFIELLELAEKYRLYADLLISQPNQREKVGKQIELNDWDGKALKISLDEKLTILDNATRYYSKAKKTEKDAVLKEKDIEKQKSILEHFLQIQEEFKQIKSYKEIKAFKTKYAKSLNLKINIKMETESKFRHFSYNGFDIFVGKSAANNDDLTMGFAKPNDIWLHARGVPGSHTIIKNYSKEKISKEIIEYAAELAAYYSQSRKASLVPVIYTEKKYVRKPKGANPGSVVVQKENVIMVKPRIGEGEAE